MLDVIRFLGGVPCVKNLRCPINKDNLIGIGDAAKSWLVG